MLKLRRLRIEKFRNVVPGTEIRFSDGFNVLLGQNGTGKTTLLELISSLVRSNFVDLQGEELSIEYEMVVGEVVILVALRNRQQAVAQPLFPQDSWRPSLEARIAAKGSTTVVHRDNGHLRVDGALVDAPELGPLLGPGVVNTTIALHGLPGLRDLVVPFLANDETVRFDESLDVFRTVMTPARTLAAMHVTRSPTSPTPFFVPGVWPSSLTLPRSMAVKLEPLYQADPAASRFVFSDRDLDFLGSAVRTMGFDLGQASIDVLARLFVGPLLDYIELGNLAFRFQFEEGGDMVFHDRLSYGQKRLLTFFCYLDMCPDIVIADELVNGLHHAWIDAAIAALGERQSFLTSQNPLLLDYLPITSPEQVRESFIFCRSERREHRPRWIWENMSAEDAVELHAAYDVGIEHVSEILQSRGALVNEEPALSVVILTEDDGKDGRPTVEALARRMLHLVVPGFASHRVHFVPREPREEAAMRGSYWKDKGKNPERRTPEERDRRVRLLRYIARRLSQPDTFVLFHIDGDRTWAERHTSENAAEFDRLVRVALPQVAERGWANGPKARTRSPSDPPPMHAYRLLLLCPFRSIEAWLYQNLRAAIDICRREHRGAHVAALRAWQERREEIDELPAPEKTVCLNKDFNLELARNGFPAREAYEVRKSFTESVDRLLGCDALARALEHTLT